MKKYTILTLLSTLLITALYAQPKGYTEMKDIETFKVNVNKAAQNTNSIKSDFVQKKHLSFLEEDLESIGKFSFKKDNLLRWEYSEPFEYLIILNDGKIVISDEGDVSSFDMKSNKAFQEINAMIINSVQGDVLDETLFDIKYYQNTKSYYVELFPKEKQMKEFITSIHLTIDTKDYSVNSMKMIESGGDYTEILFKNKKLNAAIDNELFEVD